MLPERFHRDDDRLAFALGLIGAPPAVALAHHGWSEYGAEPTTTSGLVAPLRR